MSDFYTKVRAPGAGPGYAVNGRTSRAEAVAQAREHYALQLKEAQTFLAASDAELTVTVERGLIRTTMLEVLPP